MNQKCYIGLSPMALFGLTYFSVQYKAKKNYNKHVLHRNCPFSPHIYSSKIINYWLNTFLFTTFLSRSDVPSCCVVSLAVVTTTAGCDDCAAAVRGDLRGLTGFTLVSPSCWPTVAVVRTITRLDISLFCGKFFAVSLNLIENLKEILSYSALSTNSRLVMLMLAKITIILVNLPVCRTSGGWEDLVLFGLSCHSPYTDSPG